MTQLDEIRARLGESIDLNGVFGPQAQDDIEYLIDLLDRCSDIFEGISMQIDECEADGAADTLEELMGSEVDFSYWEGCLDADLEDA